MSYLIFAGKSNEEILGFVRRAEKFKKRNGFTRKEVKKSKIIKIFGINIKNI